MKTRRDFCVASLMAMAAQLAAAQATADAKTPLKSQATRFDDIPMRAATDGRETRPCLQGQTPNVQIEMHQTKLPPGTSPHPAHRHEHDELFLVRSGEVEFSLNGKPTMLGPGSFAIAANNDLHGVRNTGKVPAEYFVVALTRLA